MTGASRFAGCHDGGPWTPTRRRSRRPAAWSGGGRRRRVELVVVHRPRYDDWSLPRASSTPASRGRTPRCARSRRRSGCAAGSAHELPPVSYRDNKGRAKVVRYWLMEPEDARADFTPNDEVDEMRWVDVGDGRRAAELPARRRAGARRAGARCEPRSLPRARRAAGRGWTGRPGRRWSTRRSRPWPRSCARATTPTTAACSPPRTRPTRAWSAPAPRSRGCSAPSRAASPSARR